MWAAEGLQGLELVSSEFNSNSTFNSLHCWFCISPHSHSFSPLSAPTDCSLPSRFLLGQPMRGRKAGKESG